MQLKKGKQEQYLPSISQNQWSVVVVVYIEKTEANPFPLTASLLGKEKAIYELVYPGGSSLQSVQM